MTKNRLEAFSDGVLAIIITIMVLEFKIPENSNEFVNLKPMIPKLISYILSFAYVGVYWNNHHHMFQIIKKINGSVLWGNLLLLFTISFLPFTSSWMGESNFEKDPVTLYGINLLCCALTFIFLEKLLIHSEGKNSKLRLAFKKNNKEMISIILSILGIIISYFNSIIAIIFYFIVILIWIIPDRRIEKILS